MLLEEAFGSRTKIFDCPQKCSNHTSLINNPPKVYIQRKQTYVVSWGWSFSFEMDPMQKPSLDQLLAIISPQGQQTLDQKISDIHLAEIARTLTNWESVCSNLGITEPEEEAIREENARADARRYVVLLPFR